MNLRTLRTVVRARVVRARGARPALMMASAFAILIALSGQLLTAPTAHAASPCEDGSNVGELCSYFSVVSNGPDYDVWATLVRNGTNEVIYEWHEGNPGYTRWWYRHDQFLGSNATMNVTVYLRGDDNVGYRESYPATENRCLLVRGGEPRSIMKRSYCP
jgi:hypothetical protein